MSLAIVVGQAQAELRLCQHNPAQYAFRLELVELILRRTADQYGALRVAAPRGADPAQSRCLALLKDGQVDLAYVPPNAQRLRDFAAIRFDIQGGLTSYRLLLIHRDDAPRFAGVRDLDDLRALRGGFGNQWSDFPLFALNRLPVIGSAYPENLLAMLEQRRFDYYHRGLNEAWNEAREHPQLMVEPHLALSYRQPVYFIFRRDNHALKERFEEGLREVLADGSFQELFRRHFGELIERSRLDQRRVLQLRDELPPDEPPVKLLLP
ncbi:transporter substrate-binding domain-containing protein [Pseudomonas sp. CAU 1711]|uniref:substrate-binding periplasmic protein n=1 Tax=Pseudomonas sp. CAU 1711 TaxID=3140356 RepID=UPI00325FF171